MIAGPWKKALVDIDRATEFTGDDVDRFTGLVDLGRDYKTLVACVPALDSSASVRVYGQRDAAIATAPHPVVRLKHEATGHVAQVTTSGSGDFEVSFDIGGLQFVRLYLSANQGADRSIWVRGVD